MQNIEFKAELRDPSLAHTVARGLGAVYVGQLWQIDTYYRLVDGRLKKRQTDGVPVEYILYHRDNSTAVRPSTFTILDEEQARLRFGSMDMPEWVVVKKLRDVYMLGNVRIHLDQVERLGAFLEFEAMVSDQHDQAACFAMVEKLRSDFTPVIGEPVSASYSDLMAMES
jgi:adenylate cyclase, class 2